MSAFFSITLTLFFVIDALGIIPDYLGQLKKFEPKRRRKIALRELCLALLIMILFHYVGQILLKLLGVTTTTVQIAGGIILFLIAIKLIFPRDGEKTSSEWTEGEPFIVPLATPLIAGPSLLAVIMIYAQEQPSDWVVLGAIFCAWLLSSLILLFAQPIYQLIRDKGLMAAQRLMGLIVALIAVQMLMQGVEGLVRSGRL